MSPTPGVAVRSAALLLGALMPALAEAQATGNGRHPPDSVTVVAGSRYQKPALYRWLFGGAYRDLWLTPIRVPVLDLQRFDGGLVADDLGGGNATLSLRFNSVDGSRYVFRTVDKEPLVLPAFAQGGLPRDVARDRTASTHPAANLIHAPFYEAGGIIHDDDAQLYVLPDDERLGEWRERLAGRLGVLTRFPGREPQLLTEYAGAIEIVDSDTLLQRLNRDPGERVDPTQYLTARLVDMLLNSWDRHPGQWKWARLRSGGAWQPVSRDMDNVLVSQDGVLPELAQVITPKAITFDSGYPSLRSLMYNSYSMDRRFLAGLSRAGFDTVARAVRDRLTDAVIAASMARMPVEYAASQPAIVAKLRRRRDSLPAIAARFHERLNAVVDLHATDAEEHATVTRHDANTVEVRIETADGRRLLERRFDARETSEIRLYLHGGDDRATIRGEVPASILVRVVGGNGNNVLVDASRVAGRGGATRLYDVGKTDDVGYGEDADFNRRPEVLSGAGRVVPARDYGRGGGPIVGLGTNRDQGIIPRLGWAWERHGFRQHPYASRIAVDGRYSFRNKGVAVALTADRRLADSRVHFALLARMSQIDLLNYHGLGNATPSTPGVAVGARAPRNGRYAVHQGQWLLHPTVAYGLGERSDLRVGPMVQYSLNEGSPGGFLESTTPYGAGTFGQAGLRASLTHDTRDRSGHPRSGVLLDVRGDYFPAIWDVQQGFGAVRATGGVSVTLPVPLQPYLGLRVSGQQVFGEFPFHEAAFIGGGGGVRTLDPQRYAGDASLAAKLELRVPVLDLTVILPFEVGLFAAQEVGRVYVDGASPGGWHNTFGAGVWVAFTDIAVSFRFIETNEVGRTPVVALQLGRFGSVP